MPKKPQQAAVASSSEDEGVSYNSEEDQDFSSDPENVDMGEADPKNLLNYQSDDSEEADGYSSNENGFNAELAK